MTKLIKPYGWQESRKPTHDEGYIETCQLSETELQNLLVQLKELGDVISE